MKITHIFYEAFEEHQMNIPVIDSGHNPHIKEFFSTLELVQPFTGAVCVPVP